MAVKNSDDWLNVVEALYPYESTNARGHSVIVQPGEMYFLIRDIDEDWWFVGRSSNDEDGFYFPRTYGKIVQRQQHRMTAKDLLSISADSSMMCNNSDHNNRLSTFGVGGGSMKRRSYQLATITDNQLAIYDNPMALANASQTAGGVGDVDQSSTEIAINAGSSLLRRKSRGPGFKLADPNRISRSIPVDLNYLHRLPNDGESGDGRIVSFYGESKQIETPKSLPESNLIRVQNENGVKKEDNTQKSDRVDQAASTKSNDGPIYANVKPMSAKELPPLPVAGSNPINLLHDGWAEYVDKNNRHYFYNAKSKKAMWKPPRMATTSGGSKSGAAVHGSVSSGDELDASFVSDDGDAFNGSRDLPLSTSITSATDSSTECGTLLFNSTSIPTSILIPPLPKKEPATETNGDHHQRLHNNEIFNNRDVDVYAYSEDLANIATKIRTSTEEQSSAIDQTNAAACGKSGAYGQNQTQNFVRYGVLNRCKYMEAGKRVKKQWLSCFVYLTNAHLIFYKDEKAAEKKGNQYPTPLGVCDLRGAKLRWLEGDVSRRKNVFEVHLLDVTVYLFHAENQGEINSWYDDLRHVIDQLPVPDCYPTPTIESNSPTRFSIRKPSASASKTATLPPELPKLPPAANNKDADKRKSVSFGHAPFGQLTPAEANEQALQKETILEKLRKFFRSRPSVETLKERGIYKAEPVFGSSLAEICRREKSTVPKFILTCTALIEEKGLSTDGLYRINGNLSQVQRIRCQVDQEKYSALLNETDVHVLTGALKLFFRELQEPAFPTSMTKDFLNAIKIQIPKQRFKVMNELIMKLPYPHHDTLDHLFQHLLSVAKNSMKNRMQIHNLAIVFGPSLFSSNPSAKAAADLPNKNKGGAAKKKVDSKASVKDKESTNNGSDWRSGQRADSSSDVTHSNSQLAYTMILQGQIVEYLLKDHGKFFPSSSGNASSGE